MSPPRGFDDVSNAVPTVEPVYFDDAPEPTSASAEDRAELFRAICDLLDCPTKKSAARVAAFRHCMGHDTRPLRQLASELGISVGNLHGHVTEIRQKMNKFSEAKPSKN